MNKYKNIISVVIFACVIFSFSVFCLAKSDSEYSISERRALAKAPEISLASISNGEYMDKFEEYTTDQFPFRDKFRSFKAGFAMLVLGRLDNNGLFVKNGHISKLDDAENEYMTNYAADKFKSIYDKYIKGKTNKVYFSVVPDKNFILAKENGYPCLDYKGFAERMKEKTSYMEYIDITHLLSLDDYYTTDTHWRQEKITDIAEEIADKMGTDVKADYKVNTLDNPFYGVYYSQLALPFKPDTIKYLTNDVMDSALVCYYDTGAAVEGDMYNMKKAYGKDPYEMFLSGVAPLVTIENPNATSDKELVMFRDSFGSSLAPLMTQGYKKITVVDIRYINSGMIGNFVDFADCDVLFMYSTALLNNSLAMK